MKTKRFTTTQVVTYRLSNSIKKVSFDTIDEAKLHVQQQREKHPRSRYFEPRITDTETNQQFVYPFI